MCVCEMERMLACKVRASTGVGHSFAVRVVIKVSKVSWLSLSLEDCFLFVIDVLVSGVDLPVSVAL